MTRVFYFVYSTYQNAGNKIIFEHANRLKQRGKEIHIITLLGSSPKWFRLKVPVHSMFHAFSLRFSDIAVATFWVTAYFVKLVRARKFYFLQAWEKDFYDNHFLKSAVSLTLKFPFTKIVNSNFLEKMLRKYVKSPSVIKKIDNIAIDTLIFKTKRKKTRSDRKIHVLAVMSWYNRSKGPDLLVEAVEKLRQKYPNTYTFTLVSLQKRPYQDIFDTFVSNPSQKQLASLYQQADVLLATSRSEGFYIPALEAMACGCLVVTTNSGGINEYAVDKRNAIILRRLSDVWKENVIEKTLKNRVLTKKLITEGHKTVKKYTWRDIINDLETIYFRPYDKSDKN